MDILNKKIDLVYKILGKQDFINNEPYRYSYHCIQIAVDYGILLYQVMTKELLLLSYDDIQSINLNKSDDKNLINKYLVEHWFLRPINRNDCDIVDKLREIANLLKKQIDYSINTYTIFTTTNCNARCFYCFEKGLKKIDMSEKTAIDVAKYIINHCGNEMVKFRWFGGEPLCNISAIDIITQNLLDNGISFESTMVSNGYLFDEIVVKKAKNSWNLKSTQITIDGTEKVYNWRKSYIYKNVNAFQRVLSNIELLLLSDIEVIVRLNMDKDNISDLFRLCAQLSERFKNYHNFHIYVAMLYKNIESTDDNYISVEQFELYNKAIKLRKYIMDLGLSTIPKLKTTITINRCMADSKSSTVVTPTGKLGMCEHFTETEIWGDIYSNEINYEIVEQWKEKIEKEDKCYQCEVYPECIRLKKCPAIQKKCTLNDQELRKEKIIRAMLFSYSSWLKITQSDQTSKQTS